MKYVLVSLLALVALSCFLLNKQSTPALQLSNIPNNVVTLYHDWKIQYNVAYAPEVDAMKLNVFYDNLKKIQEENAKQSDYELGITQFMTTTQEEFIHVYLGAVPVEALNVDHTQMEVGYTTPNGAFNWADSGKVQRVKNQGSCGSCWAFSAIATVESYYMIFKGTKLDLSEQQLVDCSRSYGNYGCNGGWPSAALSYVKDKGVNTEAAYPYTGRDGTCKVQSGSYKINSVVKNSGCSALTSDIQHEPTSVCVDASNWSLYKGGVFSNCQKNINHAVFATGWDASGNWIIKNSWGTGWGSSGYITLKAGDTCGVCQVLTMAN